jgi:hypothetical protein
MSGPQEGSPCLKCEGGKYETSDHEYELVCRNCGHTREGGEDQGTHEWQDGVHVEDHGRLCFFSGPVVRGGGKHDEAAEKAMERRVQQRVHDMNPGYKWEHTWALMKRYVEAGRAQRAAAQVRDALALHASKVAFEALQKRARDPTAEVSPRRTLSSRPCQPCGVSPRPPPPCLAARGLTCKGRHKGLALALEDRRRAILGRYKDSAVLAGAAVREVWPHAPRPGGAVPRVWGRTGRRFEGGDVPCPVGARGA